MKVTLEKNYRKLYTLDDLDRAKKVIAAEKEDDSTPMECAEMAIRGGVPGEPVLHREYVISKCFVKE